MNGICIQTTITYGLTNAIEIRLKVKVETKLCLISKTQWRLQNLSWHAW